VKSEEKELENQIDKDQESECLAVERENPLRVEKKRKLEALRQAGIDPYPHGFSRTSQAGELSVRYESLELGVKDQETSHRIAGRLMTMRSMGKAAFFNLQDQSGRLQIYLKRNELSDEERFVFDHLDIGDIVGVEGFMFKTQKGEVSLWAQHISILCKSIEPLPEKFHGLTDIELKYRHRHLDLIMDIESRKVFEDRSRIIREVRRFLDERGFLEVETPILQPLYGGAAAHPFVTHHRALDMDLYLKISPELYLKRLIVGGFEKVYDLGRNFRNEGIDRSHNPEFTMIEWYEAYTDYNYQMKQFEDLCAHLATTIRGTTKFEYQGREIDFTTPWRRLSVYDGLREFGKVDVETMDETELFLALKKAGSESETPGSKGSMIMELFELSVEEHLWHPTFIVDFPKEVSPLTKTHRDDPELVERFEPYAAGMEIGNAYTELNDPIDQNQRLTEQEAQRGTDEEAHPMDHDFIHAIEVGMPPTGGVGLGIERIVMILTNRPSIRDIILFPTLKRRK
jgi:lysyl-tRNA synthetase class 2